MCKKWSGLLQVWMGELRKIRDKCGRVEDSVQRRTWEIQEGRHELVGCVKEIEGSWICEKVSP